MKAHISDITKTQSWFGHQYYNVELDTALAQLVPSTTAAIAIGSLLYQMLKSKCSKSGEVASLTKHTDHWQVSHCMFLDAV